MQMEKHTTIGFLRLDRSEMPIKTIAKERFNGDAPEFIPRVDRLGLKEVLRMNSKKIKKWGRRCKCC